MASQTSRITNDLIASGFDRNLHLEIAQESLLSLQNAQSDYLDMKEEYEELLRDGKYQKSEQVTAKLQDLGTEIEELRLELQSAPGQIQVLGNDVALLKGYVDAEGMDSLREEIMNGWSDFQGEHDGDPPKARGKADNDGNQQRLKSS